MSTMYELTISIKLGNNVSYIFNCPLFNVFAKLFKLLMYLAIIYSGIVTVPIVWSLTKVFASPGLIIAYNTISPYCPNVVFTTEFNECVPQPCKRPGKD